jgi:hypothetical protein
MIAVAMLLIASPAGFTYRDAAPSMSEMKRVVWSSLLSGAFTGESEPDAAGTGIAAAARAAVANAHTRAFFKGASFCRGGQIVFQPGVFDKYGGHYTNVADEGNRKANPAPSPFGIDSH